MSHNCSRLRTGAAIKFTMIAFTALAVMAVMPSSAEAQPGACSAQGSIGPLPLAGFSCTAGLAEGDTVDIVYQVVNNSTTIPPGTLVDADLRGVVTNTLACLDSLCAVPIPAAFSCPS
jgi:hypothetical protein